MPLSNAHPVGFIPTRNAEAARAFFEGTIGLEFLADEPYALVFRLGSTSGPVLRVVRMGEFTPVPFTIFGWEVPNMESAVDELTGKGVQFLRYSYLEQDERGIWHAPGRAKLAWFNDPDGNVLSLAEHTS